MILKLIRRFGVNVLSWMRLLSDAFRCVLKLRVPTCSFIPCNEGIIISDASFGTSVLHGEISKDFLHKAHSESGPQLLCYRYNRRIIRIFSCYVFC